MPTQIAVEVHNGRHRTSLTPGLLRAQAVHAPPDRCRLGLVATTALLLGGDVVELDVSIGPGAVVELFDVAGTVAYHGRGSAAAWRVRLRLEQGARLRWSGEPFVVSDGASVVRSLEVDLADGAEALVRETVALGRCDEVGGVLRNETVVRRGGREVFVEDQVLDPTGHRTLPGMLANLRLIDTILALGRPGPDDIGDACRFALPAPGSSVTRYLGTELAASPLHCAWSSVPLARQQSQPHQDPLLQAT